MREGKVSVDWRLVRQRVDQLATFLSAHDAPSVEVRKRILRERAEALARVPDQRNDGDALDVIGFGIARESYAVESHFVSEVLPLSEYTPLPCVPEQILGIMNVRGRIVSLVDLSMLSALASPGQINPNRVIVLANAVREFGILASAIHGALRITRSELRPPPTSVNGAQRGYLLGLTGDSDIVLDAEALLNDPRLRVNGTRA